MASEQRERTLSYNIAPNIRKCLTITGEGDVLPIFTQTRFLDGIRKMEVRPTDIFVITYPKAGTTWIQYIVSQILLGPEYADAHLNREIHVFIEMAQHPLNPEKDDGLYKEAESLPNPRFLKSHLQMKHLPNQLHTKKPKIIYLARNPKDTAVSYYQYSRMHIALPAYKSWADFYEYFYRGLIPYGSWFNHTLSWWKKRNEANVLFMKYEDVIKDSKGAISTMSNFLGKSLSDELLDDIAKRASFDQMKNNPMVNNYAFRSTDFYKPDKGDLKFMRKGIIGDWKNYFTPAQNDQFEKLYQERMKGTGLTFEFD